MKHPEEHILELYVLNAASVSDRAAEIEEHLRTCAGCKALVGEISGFYSELDGELRKQDEKADGSVGHALSKRNPDLAVWEERLARGQWSGWSSPVKNLRYYIRRYPITAAGATFAFASFAVLGLLMGYNRLTTDTNPAYALINTGNRLFEVYNGGNNLLWSRPILEYSTTFDEANITEMERYALVDVDSDGDAEVLTPMYLGGEPKIGKTNLHVFDGKGNMSDVTYERKVTFRGDVYHYPGTINSGSILVVDSTDPDDVEIFVTVKTDRSPTGILRINSRSEVIGEYWHHGQIMSMYINDLDGDGRNEFIVCGFDDVDDKTDLPYPFIAVLDPKKLVGVTESRATRGYGFAPSEAESRYLRLPLTVVNRTLKTGACVGRMRDLDGRLVFLWSFTVGTGDRLELDFVFTKSLELSKIISSTQIHQFFEREFSAGRIPTRLDDAYLERLRGEVRFWDGERWVRGPARIGSGITH